MPSTSLSNDTLADFSAYELESHVSQALGAAMIFADGRPINGRHALRGALSQSIVTRTPAFSKLRALFPNAKEVPPKNIMTSFKDVSQVEMDAALLNSFTIAKKYIGRTKTVWGRDLVTMILLTRNDDALNQYFRELNVSPESLQDEWYNFVTHDKGPRDVYEWSSWWSNAGVPLPAERQANKAIADLASHKMVSNESQNIAIARAQRKKATKQSRNTSTAKDQDQSVSHGSSGSSTGVEEASKKFDIFLSYSIKDESVVEDIHSRITGWGFNAYFWKSDMGHTGYWKDLEMQYMLEAQLVLIFLGDTGWGPTHLEQAKNAMELHKKIITIMIGDPSDLAFTLPGENFSASRRLDLTRITKGSLKITDDSLKELKAAITREGIKPVISESPFDSPVIIDPPGVIEEPIQNPADIQELLTPGYRSDDIDVKKDFLDIEEDVKTLTAVILAREVKPPLAIGLFGDWGHGKSFFMNSIKKEVDEVREDKTYSDKKFCKEPVQIEFNAWHYVDTSLWASLVSHILSELSNHVSPQATFEEKQKTFIAELTSTQSIIQEARAQQAIAQKEIEKKYKQLRRLQVLREQKKIRLKELRPKDIYEILKDDEATARELKKTLDRLGIPSAIKSVSELEAVLKESATTGGRITSLFYSLFRSRNALILVAMLILVIGVIPGLVKIIEGTWLQEVIGDIGVVITKAATVISGLALTLKNSLGMVNAGISKVEEIKKKTEDVLAAKRMTAEPEEITLEKEIEALDVKEKQAQLVVSNASQRVADLQERIRLLNEERSLGRFLTERVQSQDYRKHLGLISTIRQDFEALTDRMANAYEQDNTKFRKVDRIILYIDDLDRCPADKVIEVLQAVHLLLAYELFVVIVGVDPRWLLHSLGSSFTAFQNDGRNFGDEKRSEDWLTTPQNFLEKIFQIQYSLRPMSSGGYRKLIKNLLSNQAPDASDNNGTGDKAGEKGAPDVTPSPENKGDQKTDIRTGTVEKNDERFSQTNDKNTSSQLKKEAGTSPDAGKDPAIGNDDGFSGGGGSSKTGPGTSYPGTNEDDSEDQVRDKFVIDEESLIIKAWEVSFAASLFNFIPSPRAAKRFSNVYRMLKASVPKKDLHQYEGTPEDPGDFQVPMLLLALVTGAPTAAVKLFPELQAQLGDPKKKADVKDIMASVHASAIEKDANYADLLARLRQLIHSPKFPAHAALFEKWIPRVSRFSFDLSQILKPKPKGNPEKL